VAIIAPVESSNAGAFPKTSSEGFTESAIWTYHQSSGELIPSWITSANMSVPIDVMMHAESSSLYVTGDMNVFSAMHGVEAPGPLSFHFNAAVVGVDRR